eukprot:SAG31_NODE_147_length_22539_cov_37.073663_4_plen_60_part_00
MFATSYISITFTSAIGTRLGRTPTTIEYEYQDRTILRYDFRGIGTQFSTRVHMCSVVYF